MRSARKIWLGVGAFAVVGGGLSAPAVSMASIAATAEHLPIGSSHAGATSSIVLAQHMDHGGEAGEAGEQGMASLPPDLQFALRIALIRGHLLVGDELVRLGRWDAALPHFLHPTEEIYVDIRGHLKEYGVPPFEAALKLLAETVKEKKGGADYANAFKTVQDVLAKAEAGLKAKHASDWAGFTIETAVEAMKTAAGEYEEAIVKNYIGKPVEYQDARGFIWHAEQMIDSVAPALEKKDANALHEVKAQLAKLKQAFPTAVPPKTPVQSHAEVLATVSKIELAAGPLM